MGHDSRPASSQSSNSITILLLVMVALFLVALLACGGIGAAAWWAMRSVSQPQAATLQPAPRATARPYTGPAQSRNYLRESMNLIGAAQYAEAAALLEIATAEQPNNAGLLNQYAWLLAVCPDDEVRDGERAVTIAEQACSLTDYSNPMFVDTLAAAYAEAGDFEKAVEWQREAITLDTNGSFRAGFEERLLRYEARTPYREGPGFQALPADPVPLEEQPDDETPATSESNAEAPAPPAAPETPVEDEGTEDPAEDEAVRS